MSNITWGDLNEGQQHEMRYLYGNMKGVIQKDVGDSLLALGLIERDGYYSRLTQSGKECIELANRATTPPQEPAPVSAAGERSMLVFHDIEEANSAIDDANDEIADLRAKLAAAEALASTNAALLANAQHEAQQLRLQVIDLEGWQTEALNRGIILERFYAQVYELNDDIATSKGAVKRNEITRKLSDLLRGFRTWSPTARASDAANALAADGEGA
jgi:hypothetical protein